MLGWGLQLLRTSSIGVGGPIKNLKKIYHEVY